MKIVATTSLEAVNHPNADRLNAARSSKIGNIIFFSVLVSKFSYQERGYSNVTTHFFLNFIYKVIKQFQFQL